MPLDISEEHLLKTADKLRTAYPHIEILPMVADFTQPFELPVSTKRRRMRPSIFPVRRSATSRPTKCGIARDDPRVLGRHGGLLIGIDLQKDPTIIEAAYNDDAQVTDTFNLNVLHRVNRDLCWLRCRSVPAQGGLQRSEAASRFTSLASAIRRSRSRTNRSNSPRMNTC